MYLCTVTGAPNRFVYGTSKAAVIGFTKSLAVDFVKYNIRANSICPGQTIGFLYSENALW